MRVLLLSRYARDGASSRVRFYQYLDHLERHGIRVTVAPLLDAAYVRSRSEHRRVRLGRLWRAYVSRVQWLLRSSRFDLLWVEGELFPGLPAWSEAWLSRFGIPYVVDYDDAVFHRYDANQSRTVRRLLGGKVNRVMRHASLVIAGNDYLAARAHRAGARRVERVPSVVDLDRYTIVERPLDGRVTVGWIGSWSTAKSLTSVGGVLRDLCADSRIRVVLVGADTGTLTDVPAEMRSWSEATEVSEIQGFDVGIMPLDEGLWEQGKCGYKLVQYMACGKPAVASPVGVNRDIITNGLNGYLARTPAEWSAALRRLCEDPHLRRRMGACGRRVVEQRYSLSATASRLRDALLRAAAPSASTRLLPSPAELPSERLT